jgi:mutator protein MutT
MSTAPLSRIKVCLGIVVHNDRVLIGLRPPGVRLAGFWEFPGGKLEAGETPQQCALREVREECGLAVHAQRALETIVHADEDLTVEIHPFLCRPAGDVDERTPDSTTLRWVRLCDLSRYRFPPANAPLLRQLEQLEGGA